MCTGCPVAAVVLGGAELLVDGGGVELDVAGELTTLLRG